MTDETGLDSQYYQLEAGYNDLLHMTDATGLDSQYRPLEAV